MPIETGKLEAGDRIQVRYVSLLAQEVGGKKTKVRWVAATVEAVYPEGTSFKLADVRDDEGRERDIQWASEWRWPLN